MPDPETDVILAIATEELISSYGVHEPTARLMVQLAEVGLQTVVETVVEISSRFSSNRDKSIAAALFIGGLDNYIQDNDRLKAARSILSMAALETRLGLRGK